MQLAEATKLNGVVTTSSPASTPAARIARWRPAVPLDTAEPRSEREPARAQRLDHELLLARAQERARQRDELAGHVTAVRARRPRERPGSMPASSESTSASQLASMMFSETPIEPHVSCPSLASTSTRVTAPVP